MKRVEKKEILTAFAILMMLVTSTLFFALMGCGQADFQAIPTHMTNFRGILVNDNAGKKNSRTITSYSEQKGIATLVVLSAAWCPGCREELPLLKDLLEEFAPRGFRVLMISEDDNPAVANRYKKKNQMEWEVIHWNYDIMNALGNPGVIPVSYLVNYRDSIVQTNVGVFDMKVMRKKIEDVLK